MDAFIANAVVGAAITGAAIGLIPAISGGIKGKIGLAIGGFFACLVSGIILGLLLAVPVCVVFLFLIFKKPRVNKDQEAPVHKSDE